MSDSRYFDHIVECNKINSPKKSFDFVLKQTRPIRISDNCSVISGLSPRYLLSKRKFLWCDEGAILFITIVNKLGYETRLVDLLDESGVSRHTIAEVFENGRWIQYDYTNNTVNTKYEFSVTGYIPRHRYRVYPRIYNYLIQNNFFIHFVVNWIRNIPL